MCALVSIRLSFPCRLFNHFSMFLTKRLYCYVIPPPQAKCRAEISRLKSSAQSVSFRSPNRSILDESDDALDTESDHDEGNEIRDAVINRTMEQNQILDADHLMDDTNGLDSSFQREDGPMNDSHVKVLELERYKAALNEANTVIRRLHSTLQNYHSDYVEGTAPLVVLPSLLDKNESHLYDGGHNVNDHMLESNNDTPEWVDLDPPLPSPPDHDLQSPIVEALLEMWTSDRTLHQSLIDWIDQVLTGFDSETIPPLTLSNLDQPARDGFVVHVLPLLLRRPDVRVDVKTRINRRTTYDLAVSVNPAATNLISQQRFEQPNLQSSIIGLYDNTKSSTAAHMMNKKIEESSDYVILKAFDDRMPAMSKLSYDEMAEDIALSDASQPGLMGTWGGALGGLLLPRNRKVAVTATSTSSLDSHQEPSYLTIPLSSRRSAVNGTAMPTIVESPSTIPSDILQKDDVVRFVEMDHEYDHPSCNTDQPYHRVVSAPSGRIGVTFVDYRGHCMVSDVYHDSPLIGWMFPSDVLIAIDDTPVSGLPIRDIIKLLKDRSHNSQRALRVISSHAMNELTLNAGVIVNDTTG
jgi:hypothetical protein